MLKSLMGSYPVERAHSLVDTLFTSPSFSEAEARAAASSGFPVKQTRTFPMKNNPLHHKYVFSAGHQGGFMEQIQEDITSVVFLLIES